MKPLISIIIPCYNAEKYIDRCITSLTTQTIGIENLELIFVDDASTDNTFSVLQKYEQQYPDNILLIHLDENVRQGGARNVGLSYASANHIGFVDVDDWVETTMYEELYTKATEYNCDVVACGFMRDNGSEILFTQSLEEDKIIYLTTKEDRIAQYNQMQYGLGVWNKIYKRELIFDNDLFFPEKLAYEDNYWGLISRYYTNSMYFIHKPLYHYYHNPLSTSCHPNATHHFDRLTIELLKLDYYQEHHLFDEYYHRIEADFLQLFYINTLNIIFTRFDYIPYDIICYMQKMVMKHFPHYKDNPYVDHPFLGTVDVNLTEQDWKTIGEKYLQIIS